MMNVFNTVKLSTPKYNVFDLTHDVKMTGQMGTLMPVMTMEVVPGDSVTIGADTLIRFAPMIAPVMHRFDATIHYFFVPYRILWPNWEKFITNEVQHDHPYILKDNSWTPSEERLADYLGFPPVDPAVYQQPVEISAFPFAAYQAIYNEYYRDQNLIAEVPYQVSDGNNPKTILASMRNRAWMHDYFTACLPWAQKGPQVQIPLGEILLNPTWQADGDPRFETNLGVTTTAPVQSEAVGPQITVGPDQVVYNPDGSLITPPKSLNDLRRAFKLQEWLERNARAGTRYIENILAHFGVRSSDARLQRPEYITGVKQPVVISEVLNTTGLQGERPQGSMAGHAVSVGEGNVGRYKAEEHGLIMGIMSIMPLPAYQQGIHKSWLRKDPLDYYWPSFANIGEQEVKNVEIYSYRTDDENTFGYIPRYSELRYMPNRVAGEFRSSLSFWHAGRIFANAPALNQEFIECDHLEVARIFAVEDEEEDPLYIHVLNKVMAKRPLPQFGTPMI